MGTSSPMVPKLSTEILLIPAILEGYHKESLNTISERKNSIYAFWMQISFCHMCREKVVKTQGIFE